MAFLCNGWGVDEIHALRQPPRLVMRARVPEISAAHCARLVAWNNTGMGRRPTPTAVLKMRGSWRANAREKRGDIAPTPGELIPLPSVANCPHALALFNALAAVLKAQGIAGASDSIALSILVYELSRGYIAHERMNESGGMVIEGRINPWFTAMKEANRSASRMCLEFGITPRARERLPGNHNFNTGTSLEELVPGFLERLIYGGKVPA